PLQTVTRRSSGKMRGGSFYPRPERSTASYRVNITRQHLSWSSSFTPMNPQLKMRQQVTRLATLLDYADPMKRGRFIIGVVALLLALGLKGQAVGIQPTPTFNAGLPPLPP